MIYTLAELPLAVNYLLEQAKSHTIWCFHGQMGVGKTTLIKQLLLELGVKDLVSSPSFSIVNEYKTEEGKSIYHFDFYRIKSVEEAYDLGFEMYFDSGNLCLIEWPEKIAEILENETCLSITLSLCEEKRKLIIA